MAFRQFPDFQFRRRRYVYSVRVQFDVEVQILLF